MITARSRSATPVSAIARSITDSQSSGSDTDSGCGPPAGSFAAASGRSAGPLPGNAAAAIVPKGARIRARVAAIDRRAFRGYTAGIGIQIVEIEHEGQIVPLKAEIVEGGSVSLRTAFYALLPAAPGRPSTVYVKSTPPRLLKGLVLQLRVIP